MVEKGSDKTTGKKSNRGRKTPGPKPKRNRQSRADDNINPSPVVKAHSDTSLMKRTAFLRCLYNGMSATRACETVGLARSWVYNLRDRDTHFSELWDKALKEGHTYRMEVLEETMQERALNGFVEETEEFAIGMVDGQPVEVPVKRVRKRREDPRALLALLEVGNPEKWKPAGNVKATVGLDDGLNELIKRVQESEDSGLDSLVQD